MKDKLYSPELALILSEIKVVSERQEIIIDDLDKVKKVSENLKTAIVGSEDGKTPGINSRISRLEAFNCTMISVAKYVGTPVLVSLVSLIFWKIKTFFGVHD